MAEKPGFNAVTGFQGGVSVGITAETWEEFVTLARQVWGEEGSTIARGLYEVLKRNAVPVGVTEQQAVGMLQQQMGAVPAPLPQQYQPNPAPQGWQQAPPPQQQAPDNGPPPGQTCDPRDPRKTKWVPGGYSTSKQKHYKGFWALP